MNDDIRSRIREDGLYVGVDGSVKDPRAACPKMEQILARKQEKLSRKRANMSAKTYGGVVRVKDIDCEKERYSICLVNVTQGRAKTYFKYFRVADFDPEGDANELAPAIIQADATTLEEAQANPDHLYNPSAAANYESRESDYYLLQWRVDPYDHGRQLTRSFHDDTSLLGFKEPREVIIPSGVSSESDLRQALSTGIPFSGKTTSVFYLAYDNRGDAWFALKCQRKDFLFSDGLIKLPVDYANARSTVLSAPRVVLNGCDIIESPHPSTSYRKVYARLDEPKTNGSVPLRSLNYYAADYVKWFIRDESMQITKANRSAINNVIECALSRPAALEEYLGTSVPEDEIVAFKSAVCDVASNEDDFAKAILRNALLKDEALYQECLNQVASENGKALEAKRHEIVEMKKAVDAARSSLSELDRELSSRREDKVALEEQLTVLDNQLDELRSSRESALEEIYSNIALKLGLGAAASCSRGISSLGSPVLVESGKPFVGIDFASDFVSVLAHNLKQVGITSVVGKPVDQRAGCAKGVLGALAATKCLAVPSDIARPFSDALCACVAGRSAKRVVVPADCRDFKGVLGSINDEDAVVVVENVIDAVNEGVLFAIMAASVKPIIVFSFASHSSAQLLAKEAWGRLFLPQVESLVVYPSAARSGKFRQVEGGLTVPEVSLDDALESAGDLRSCFDSFYVQGATLLLAGTVMMAMEGIDEEGPVEPYVSQHLLMASDADESAFRFLDDWSEDDNGLSELAFKLGIDEF